MSIESSLKKIPGGSHEWTITLTGDMDIVRFGIWMLHQQVEFCDEASRTLSKLRRQVGASEFDSGAKMLLGEERFKTLKQYFTRRPGGDL